METGFLITLEGGEGVGKSTQVRRLVARLEAAGKPSLATREPGGSAKAEAIRGLLLSGTAVSFGPAAEAVLFAAARVDHLNRLIRPALAKGVTVVCDRFIDSTRVYQGIDRRVEPRFLAALERVTVGPTRPDLTIILDLPSAVGLARAAARRAPSVVPDRFEREALAFHEGLRQGFLAIAQAEPDRCAVIEAKASADEVAERIWQAFEDRLFAPQASVR